MLIKKCHFLPQAYARNFMNAWKLEAQRLQKKGLSAVSWRNELIWWYSISALALAAFTIAFGWLGAAFFLGQTPLPGSPPPRSGSAAPGRLRRHGGPGNDPATVDEGDEPKGRGLLQC